MWSTSAIIFTAAIWSLWPVMIAYDLIQHQWIKRNISSLPPGIKEEVEWKAMTLPGLYVEKWLLTPVIIFGIWLLVGVMVWD